MSNGRLAYTSAEEKRRAEQFVEKLGLGSSGAEALTERKRVIAALKRAPPEIGVFQQKLQSPAPLAALGGRLEPGPIQTICEMASTVERLEGGNVRYSIPLSFF